MKLELHGLFVSTPLGLSSIGWMLRNPFYYGVFLHKGEMHQGLHVPMISKQTFDEIQTALVTIGKPRKKRGDKGFLFLNFATCGTCGHCITAERHTKRSGRRYRYYRCSHKNKLPHLDDRSLVREEKFADEVRRNAALVVIPDDWKEKFLPRSNFGRTTRRRPGNDTLTASSPSLPPSNQKSTGSTPPLQKAGLSLPSSRN